MIINNRQAGFVLIVTVVITSIIAIVVLTSGRIIRTTNNVISQRVNYNKADHISSGAIEFSLGILNSEEKPVNYEKLEIIIDDVKCEVTIECENGKINVNNLVNQNDEYNLQYIQILSNLIDKKKQQDKESNIQSSLIASLIDALDTNEEITRIKINGLTYTGAEKKYYLNHNLPICRDGFFRNITDIYFVKEFSQNINNQLLIKSLTVNDNKRIDINSASVDVIAALSPDISNNLAAKLTVTNKDAGYSSLEEFFRNAKLDASESTKLHDIITVSPSKRYYTITVQFSIYGQSHQLTAYVNKNNENIYIIDYYRKYSL